MQQPDLMGDEVLQGFHSPPSFSPYNGATDDQTSMSSSTRDSDTRGEEGKHRLVLALKEVKHRHDLEAPSSSLRESPYGDPSSSVFLTAITPDMMEKIMDHGSGGDSHGLDPTSDKVVVAPGEELGCTFQSPSKSGVRRLDLPLSIPQEQDIGSHLEDEEQEATPTLIAAPSRRRSGSGSGGPSPKSGAGGVSPGAVKGAGSPTKFRLPQPLILDALSSSSSVNTLPSPSGSGGVVTPTSRLVLPSKGAYISSPRSCGSPGFNLNLHLDLVTGGLFGGDDSEIVG
jgi:hypothetical protein